MEVDAMIEAMLAPLAATAGDRLSSQGNMGHPQQRRNTCVWSALTTKECSDHVKAAGYDVSILPFLPALMSRMSTRSSRRGWILTGPTGCGKTTAAEWCRWAANKGRQKQEWVQMRNVLDIYDDIYDVMQREGHMSEDKKAAYGLTRGECLHEHSLDLIIDDLGAEPRMAIHYGQRSCPLQEMLMRRYVAYPQAKTYITTNLTMDEIAREYGDRVRSRLEEMCDVITLQGVDLRRRDR